jgi:methionine synthase I (cobalamin-dependent)
MPNTYSWTINALDTYPTQDSLTDVVYNIHWGLTATSDQNDADGNAYMANSIGTQTVAAPNADDYTAFDDLTQAIVEGWLGASDLDVDAIKASLNAQIVEKITPTSVTRQLPTQAPAAE